MRLRPGLIVAYVLGAATVAALTLGGWWSVRPTWPALRPETAHQRYARSLTDGGLAGTAIAADWLAAAARAVAQPVDLAAPFTEEALIDAARPTALGYAIPLKRGQALQVAVTVATDTPGRVFLDLFAPAEGEAERRAAASATGDQTSLSHEARATGTYVLRVQPELLRGGRVRVSGSAAPSLRFPVAGAADRQIQSIFGDARDAGRRRHEGIDIFAPRGTPVLAGGDGVIVRVGETALGGRVVWLWDMSRGVRLYYAHLDEQLVRTGTVVRAGDTLGRVGNTGNARTTAPHLHFGVYAPGEGALDPDGFVRPVAAPRVPSMLSAAAVGEWVRTRANVSLRASPSASAAVLEVVPRATVVRVEGALSSWIRTSTRRHPTAFVQTRELDLSSAAEAQ